MEASPAATPEKVLAIVVTKRMLYGEETPLVGVRLMYKPHYISTEPFSAAYMHLHVWHAAGSHAELEDKLNSSQLLFVNLSEVSDVLPIVVQHPVLLDVVMREAMMKTGEPMTPLHFRGFRLHTVWTQQPGEDLVRQVAFLHFLGEATSSMLEYELERFPQDLMQGQKMAVNLRQPSSDHWNVISDLVFPLTIDSFRQRREAKQMALHQEERYEGAEAVPPEAPAPGKSLQEEVEGGRETLPGGITLPRQCVIKTMQEILARIHALHLQNMHEMGSVWELDQTLAHTLMAKFARLQLIVGQDLIKSLIVLRLDLEGSSEALLSDIAKTLDLYPTNPASSQLKAILQKFQQATSLRVNLPLMELQAAQEDVEGFLQHCLQEISSQAESQDLIKGLTRKLSAHASRVQELVSVPELGEEEVSLRVTAGLAADHPLEANFFPGILEGVTGKLGLTPPGVPDPPASARAGVSQQWAAALREAVLKMEGRDIGIGQVAHDVLPPRLCLDYDLDFQTRRVDDIAPTLTPSLLSGPVGNICRLKKPEIPTQPIPFEAEDGMGGCGWVSPKLEAPGPSRNVDVTHQIPASKGEVPKSKPLDQGRNQHDQLMFKVNPEDAAKVIVSDDDDIDLTLKEPQAASTPVSEPAHHRKESLEDQDPPSPPSKKRATKEEGMSMLYQEEALPTGGKDRRHPSQKIQNPLWQ